MNDNQKNLAEAQLENLVRVFGKNTLRAIVSARAACELPPLDEARLRGLMDKMTEEMLLELVNGLVNINEGLDDLVRAVDAEVEAARQAEELKKALERKRAFMESIKGSRVARGEPVLPMSPLAAVAAAAAPVARAPVAAAVRTPVVRKKSEESEDTEYVAPETVDKRLSFTEEDLERAETHKGAFLDQDWWANKEGELKFKKYKGEDVLEITAEDMECLLIKMAYGGLVATTDNLNNATARRIAAKTYEVFGFTAQDLTAASRAFMEENGLLEPTAKKSRKEPSVVVSSESDESDQEQEDDFIMKGK